MGRPKQRTKGGGGGRILDRPRMSVPRARAFFLKGNARCEGQRDTRTHLLYAMTSSCGTGRRVRRAARRISVTPRGSRIALARSPSADREEAAFYFPPVRTSCETRSIPRTKVHILSGVACKDTQTRARAVFVYVILYVHRLLRSIEFSLGEF